MIRERATSAIYEEVVRGFNSIGYDSSLLYENYEFTDIFSPDFLVKQIRLAAFYQNPPSYRNACFGVCIANGSFGESLVSEYRSLGALQLFEISPKGLTLWRIDKEGNPQPIEFVEVQQIADLFSRHKDEWAPSRIKSLRDISNEQQLSFADIGLLPLLDHEVQTHFDRLLTRIIKQSLFKYPEVKNEYRGLFRLIFRLITAKIMADRKNGGSWLQDNPRLVIKEVENYYFKSVPPEPVLPNPEVQHYIWQEIRSSLNFQNLSVEALAYVYEHTLMSPEFRKETGTHGTPPAIAEYIVRHLPFQDIPESERHVFEPFGGHSIFLVAALGRLRDLLPSDIALEQRHLYLKSMLSSLEIDDFAREVARIMLNNADYPNPNGWHLYHGDVFQSDILERELSKSNVVLCNPPFEEFTEKEKTRYQSLSSTHKPVEILNRVLKQPPKLLGFVLPRVFITGRGYKEIRQTLANTYSSLEILALPDNVFRHSGADTILLIAHGENTGKVNLTVGQVYKRDLNNFYSTYQPSYIQRHEVADPKDIDEYIWLPELREVWDALSDLQRLDDYTIDIHRGVEYNFSLKASPHRAFSKEPRPNFVRGLVHVSESLEPFFIHDTRYLNINPKDMRGNAYKAPWDRPKIIVNAFRNTRTPWRIMAASDYEGLYCTQSFDGVWLKENASLAVFEAILNSPIANAYISDRKISARENNISVIRQIPIPKISEAQRDRIETLVKEYKQARLRCLNSIFDESGIQQTCLRLLKQIDGEVLSAYGLTHTLEEKLLEYFTGSKRPVPVEFEGYYPDQFRSRLATLQNRIYSIDLSTRGTPEERAVHQVEVLKSLDTARKRANTARIGEE